MSDRVTIYGREACVYCERAREHLASQGIPFTYHNLTVEAEKRAELSDRLGYTAETLPQIFIGPVHIGGCDDLRSLSVRHLQSMVAGS